MSQLASGALHKFLTGETVTGDDTQIATNINIAFELLRLAHNDTDTKINSFNTNVLQGGGVFRRKNQVFIATEGQTVFTLTEGSYTTGNDRLSIYVETVRQSLDTGAFSETSSTSFTLSEGVSAGIVVEAEWYEGVIVTPSDPIVHASRHAADGVDPLDITDLQGYQNTITANLTRQALINGNFDVWQRGTSFSGGGYLSDRWVYNVGSGGTVAQSRQAFTAGQTDVPNEPTYYFRANISVAFSDSNLTQRIENVRIFAGRKVTLSFYAKADAAKTLDLQSYQNFGSGGSAEVGVGVGTANLTTAWQKFTYTFTVPSITGKTIGNESFLSIVLRTGTQTGIFDLAQIQVNAGDQALPLQPRSFAEELQLCMRYYEKSYNYVDAPAANTGSGRILMSRNYTDSAYYDNVPFRVRKRISPTLTLYTTSGGVLSNDGFTSYDSSIDVNVAGTASILTFQYTADAEL